MQNTTSKKQLSELSDIQIGYQIRDRFSVSGAQNFGIGLLQVKDLPGIASGRTTPKDLPRVSPTGDFSRYLVSKGDVLFLARGSSPMAVLIEEPLSNVLAPYYFYIIRTKTESVLPAFLALFLNLPKTREYFKKNMRGTLVKSLPIAVLSDMPVPIPDIKTQEQLVAMERLRRRENDLLGRLTLARDQWMSGLVYQALKTHMNNEEASLG